MLYDVSMRMLTYADVRLPSVSLERERLQATYTSNLVGCHLRLEQIGTRGVGGEMTHALEDATCLFKRM